MDLDYASRSLNMQKEPGQYLAILTRCNPYSIFLSLGGVNRLLDVTADIVFMVDSSASVGSENYQKEKEFVKSLARLVNVTSEKSKVAVIAYSTRTIPVVQFDGYQSLDDLDEKVDDMPLLGGSYRRMDVALQKASQILLNSARQHAPKIAVLLTAGRQIPSGVSLDTATQPVRSLNGTVIVVALGQQYDKRELDPVVSEPKDLFEIESFDVLLSRARTIGKAIEEKSGNFLCILDHRIAKQQAFNTVNSHYCDTLGTVTWCP